MKIQGFYSGYVFSGNPVIVNETWPDGAFDPNGGSFYIEMGGTRIYEGRFFPPLAVDISEIIAANNSYFPEPPADNTDPLVVIEDAGELASRVVNCSFVYDGIDVECSFIAIPGGISRQNYRQFLALGSDVFTKRFLNQSANFFLSTKSPGNVLEMKETELYPLYFMSNVNSDNMRAVAPVDGSDIDIGTLETGIYALDVSALRLAFVNKNGVLPSVFDIYRGDSRSCRIVIKKSDVTRDRWILKFRNSLGVFELIELTGELSVTPAYKDNENACFKVFDSVMSDFVTRRERVERTLSFSVGTGVKNTKEVRFLMDMLGSDEVYLLSMTPLPIRVIPSVEDYVFVCPQNSPEKFTIKLEVAEPDVNIMDDISDGSEWERSRIFTSQFDEQFN